MLRFIHAADIHLDSPLAGLCLRAEHRADDFVKAPRRAFERLIDHALRERVDLFLIAGDLFDGDWRDFSTGLFFVSQMARLHGAGIPVGIIKGNHDAVSVVTRTLNLPPNVHLFGSARPETWEPPGLGVAVHGQSFPNRAVPENIALDYPAPRPGLLNIGLLHTSLDGRPGHAAYAPCALRDLTARGYDYWALGHVHGREVVSQSPWVVYPGNLQGRHANETGAKGFTLVTAEGQTIRSAEAVTADVVRWARVTADLTGCDTFDDACGRIGRGLVTELEAADGRALAVRLTLSGRTAAHRRIAGDLERTRAECAALAERAGDVWIERVVVETAEPGRDGPPSADAFAELLRTVEAIKADPLEMAELRQDLEQALAKVPAPARRLVGLEDLDEARLASVLDGAAATLLHHLLDGSR
ncbi:metallophosphoesterase family protein [Rhodospirillum centenum]|uniref:Exonuclease, putative n=1 Tax=Rhodospirillum centenum (strain ATCC 51521 / SW) TaxID=414684 RepID=B6IR03_RHOCS|nr:DNA repair exonuclease [Rhodospirillum centenum]ACI97889.1 exonuclease, putative [Rhodospirillum centenum SW]